MFYMYMKCNVNFIKSCLYRPLTNVYTLRRYLMRCVTCLQKEQISSLYVPGRYEGDIYHFVKPFINTNFIITHSDEIQENCNIREIDLNVKDLLELAKLWEPLNANYKLITQKLTELTNDLEQLKRSNVEEYNILKQKRRVYRKEMTDIRLKMYDIEDMFMPLLSRIPNSLRINTPKFNDICHYTHDVRTLPYDLKSHVIVGSNTSCLEVSQSSPAFFHLVGQLSLLEQAIQDYFECQLSYKNFNSLSLVDFSKSFIVEACGSEANKHHIQIEPKEKRELGQRLYLLGVSLETFCAYFINMNINLNNAPQKYLASGTSFFGKPRTGEKPSLFNTVQSNTVQCVIVSKPGDADHCYSELCSDIFSCFTQLYLPYRIVNVSAKKLNPTESERTELQLWSPYANSYIPCCSVSQHEDFLGKRLQMTYGVEFMKEGYVNIVHGVAAHISVIIGCIIENYQTENGTFMIPQVLKKFMFV